MSEAYGMICLLLHRIIATRRTMRKPQRGAVCSVCRATSVSSMSARRGRATTPHPSYATPSSSRRQESSRHTTLWLDTRLRSNSVHRGRDTASILRRGRAEPLRSLCPALPRLPRAWCVWCAPWMLFLPSGWGDCGDRRAAGGPRVAHVSAELSSACLRLVEPAGAVAPSRHSLRGHDIRSG